MAARNGNGRNKGVMFSALCVYCGWFDSGCSESLSL